MASPPIDPKFHAAVKRRRDKQLKGLGRAFRVAPAGTSKAAILRSQAATVRAILGTKAAVLKISKARGISAGAAATILSQVAAGTFKEPRAKRPVSTRAGQVTRRGIVRGIREVASIGAPPGIPGLGSTTTSRVRRRITGTTRAGGGRTGRATLTAGRRTLREVKRFGAGFFGR